MQQIWLCSLYSQSFFTFSEHPHRINFHIISKTHIVIQADKLHSILNPHPNKMSTIESPKISCDVQKRSQSSGCISTIPPDAYQRKILLSFARLAGVWKCFESRCVTSVPARAWRVQLLFNRRCMLLDEWFRGQSRRATKSFRRACTRVTRLEGAKVRTAAGNRWQHDACHVFARQCFSHLRPFLEELSMPVLGDLVVYLEHFIIRRFWRLDRWTLGVLVISTEHRCLNF